MLLVVIPWQYGLIWVNWYGFFTILIPVYAFLVLPCVAVVFADPKRFLTRISEIQWGLMISVYCISHVPALLTLYIPAYRGRSALLMVFLLLVVQASDLDLPPDLPTPPNSHDPAGHRNV